MNTILVIEDDDGIRANLCEMLEMEGYSVSQAEDGEAGVRAAFQTPPGLIICDITMPVLDGYGVLRALQGNPATSGIPFIFLTARAARTEVRKGMNLGASDYIPKPFTREEILESVRARLRRSTSDPAPPMKVPSVPPPSADGLVMADPAMSDLMTKLDKVARGTISVMILGETGVGKEVLAREVHRRSGRTGVFVALNCAALSEHLLESELFGHEKGAFTGAVQQKKGLFETAEGGTLFLDELGEMPQSTQVKLLRVLEDRKVVRVGGRTPREIDVRFVSATNRDVLRDSGSGLFRTDLMYRLNAATLVVPPLRERKRDILPLAQLFIARSCELVGKAEVPVLTAGAEAKLIAHPWPGNIRELRNVIERAVLISDGSSLSEHDLFDELPHQPVSGGPESAVRTWEGVSQQLYELERQRVVEALSECGGNQTQAAAQLGISRRTLVSRLDEYGLPRPRKRTS